MATKIVWTEPSLEDLRETYVYISRDSEVNAAMVLERIISSVDHIRDFPLSGRVVPEFGAKEIREVVLGSFRVVYRIKRGSIQILRVSHSARRMA